MRWIFNRHLWVVLGMGFFSGLPLGLSGSTLQAWYAIDGLNIQLIGVLTLVGQPYIFKFLWAPVLDKVRFPWLSMRRDWLLLIQLILITLLCAMAFQNPAHHPLSLGITALLLATASATQDIAIDAYRTELLKPTERGLGAAFYVMGYRVAMVLSGGVALIVAHHWRFSTLYVGMAVLMGIGVLLTLWVPKVSEGPHKKEISWRQVLRDPWLQWFSRVRARWLLLFIVLYKLSDAMAMSLTTVFLLQGLSLSLVQVGWLYKVVGFAATLGGAFLGGALLTRWSLYRALWVFGIFQGLSNLTYFFLASSVSPPLWQIMSAVFIENFGSGMGTSALIALLMALCHPQYAATQFALLTALSAIGRVWVGPVAGYWVATYGWAMLFLLSVFLAVPGLILLRYLKAEIK